MTVCTVPFDMVAVAVNDAMPPIIGVAPFTEIAETVGVEMGVLVEGVGEAGAEEPPPPQQTASMAIATQMTTRRIRCTP